MNVKSLLPWVCVLGLLAGLGWLYAVTQKQEAELAVLRQDSQQLQTLRAEQEEASTTRAKTEGDELARLRKDNEELLRLRNEVRQLRGDKQQLATQVQQAQAQVQGARAQIEALRVTPGQAGIPGQPGATAQAVARVGQAPPNLEQINPVACINTLRLIDGAKQQWALEKQKPGGALLTAADLAPYMKSNAVPTCPAGGVYTLNPVSVAPICSIPGHALPR